MDGTSTAIGIAGWGSAEADSGVSLYSYQHHHISADPDARSFTVGRGESSRSSTATFAPKST